MSHVHLDTLTRAPANVPDFRRGQPCRGDRALGRAADTKRGRKHRIGTGQVQTFQRLGWKPPVPPEDPRRWIGSSRSNQPVFCSAIARRAGGSGTLSPPLPRRSVRPPGGPRFRRRAPSIPRPGYRRDSRRRSPDEYSTSGRSRACCRASWRPLPPPPRRSSWPWPWYRMPPTPGAPGRRDWWPPRCGNPSRLCPRRRFRADTRSRPPSRPHAVHCPRPGPRNSSWPGMSRQRLTIRASRRFCRSM